MVVFQGFRGFSGVARIKEMGGSLACEPAMLAGEWAGRFGKLVRGKRGGAGWTMSNVRGGYTANDADALYRQKMLYCTSKKGVLRTKKFSASELGVL